MHSPLYLLPTEGDQSHPWVVGLPKSLLSTRTLAFKYHVERLLVLFVLHEGLQILHMVRRVTTDDDRDQLPFEVCLVELSDVLELYRLHIAFEGLSEGLVESDEGQLVESGVDPKEQRCVSTVVDEFGVVLSKQHGPTLQSGEVGDVRDGRLHRNWLAIMENFDFRWGNSRL